MKQTILNYAALIIILFLCILLCYTNLKAHRVETKLEERLLAVQTELLDGQLIEQENISLREYISKYGEPIILPKTEVKEIVRVQYKPVEVTRTEVIEASPEPFQYIYKWDNNGLPIAKYDWNGKHNFITPEVTFNLVMESGDVGNAIHIEALSSLEPTESYEIIPVNATDFIIKDNATKQRSTCKWCWGAAGLALGVAGTACAVKLAGELK